MPRTKLCKGNNVSSDKAGKNTQTKSAKAKKFTTSTTNTTKPEDIMADFVVPDDLRKQLEYPANVRKRQLAQEHVEKKLTERLETIKARLKTDRVKVGVKRQGDSLYLQATLTTRPDRAGKTNETTEQTTISLGIPFSLDGLTRIDKEARELGTLLALGKFEWNDYYLGSKAPKPETVPTIGELLEQFESKYFANRKRNRQSETTFKKHMQSLNKYLQNESFLTKEVIKNTIESIIAGSAIRRNLVIALSVFCNTFEFKFDFKGYKKGYEPKDRKLPSDREIEENFCKFQPSKYHPSYQWQEYQWAYGILATYGLRPHEVFAIHVESYIDPANTFHELKLDESLTDGTKTGERTVFPLHPEWVELFDLKNVKLPKNSGKLKSRAGKITDNFTFNKIDFSPYNLRHAYAVRGHALGVPIKEMADNMGHSVDMHTKTYQKYMTIDTRRIVYQNAINKARNVKTEQSENELLKAEIATLKSQVSSQQTEIESLRKLLVEHQLEGLLADG